MAFYREHADRVTHVHLKDTRYADTGEEYRMPGAESTMLKGGAGRRIERWFYELGTDGGLVDVPGFVAALREHDYARLGRRRERPRRQPGGAGHAQQLVPAARAGDREVTAPERAIKWSYMDHWRSNGPAGPIDQWHSRKTMSAFLKQIKATGFDAIDTFDFRIWQMYGDYGGPAKYQEMVQDHGLERIVNTFHAADYDVRNYAPHLPETHENIFEDFRVTMGRWSEIQLDNIIVMPATLYYDMEPVTEDKLKYTAECWNKVGEITAGFGVKLTCHHEFFCGIQSEADIDTFYSLHRPAVRLAVRRHRAALHRRPRPGGAVQPARAPGQRVPLQGHPATWPPATTTGTAPTPRSWRRPPASGSTRWARRTGWSTSRR